VKGGEGRGGEETSSACENHHRSMAEWPMLEKQKW